MSNSFLVAASEKTSPSVQALTVRDGVSYYTDKIASLLEHKEDRPLLIMACRRYTSEHTLGESEFDIEQALIQLMSWEDDFRHRACSYLAENKERWSNDG